MSICYLKNNEALMFGFALAYCKSLIVSILKLEELFDARDELLFLVSLHDRLLRAALVARLVKGKLSPSHSW